MCTVALALTAATTVFSAYQSKQTSDQQAALYSRQAQNVRNKAQFDTDRERDEGLRRRARLSAGAASTGFDSTEGILSAVQVDQAQEDQLNLEAIAFGANNEAGVLDFQSAQSSAKGRSDLIGGFASAIAPSISSKQGVTSLGYGF